MVIYFSQILSYLDVLLIRQAILHWSLTT